MFVKRITNVLGYSRGFAAIAFAGAVEITESAQKKMIDRIAVASNCHLTSIDDVQKKYSAALIAEQLEYKLNNEIKEIVPDEQSWFAFRLRENNYVVSARLKGPQNDWAQWTRQTDNLFKNVYCSKSIYWGLVRRINYGLVIIIVHWADERVVHWRRFESRSCLGVPL